MIGLIVDGVGDFSALKARYGAAVKILKADGPRGHTASEQAIAQAAKKQVAMLVGYGCTKIALLTDFEGRNYSADSFCRRAAIFARKGCGVDVIILVADQMIENWFLADIAFLSTKKGYLRDVKKQKSFESSHGKNELKKFFKAGQDYNEVRHGAELFPLIRGDEAARMSASFDAFRKALGLT